MDVLTQWQRISWSAASRGGDGARTRTAAVQPTDPPRAALPFVHEIRLSDRTGYRPQDTLEAGLPADVELRQEQGRLYVRPILPRYGLPVRNRRPPGCRLDPGGWLQWQVNYRFHADIDRIGEPAAEHPGWFYRWDILRLAFRPGPGDPFDGEPAHRIDERADLTGNLRS